MAITKKKKKLPKTEIIYVRVDRMTKNWLKSACKKQPRYVSQSTMIQRILVAAKQNPKFFNAAK